MIDISEQLSRCDVEQSSNNPPENSLGAGLTEDQVQEAVARSGYPLQTTTSDLLRAKVLAGGARFDAREEWIFIDKDTEDLRTIDILAGLRLHEWAPQPRVRPQLNLLIECKQSELPYVFFETSQARWLLDFPKFAGLRRDKITLTSDDDPSSWTFTISHALDLDRDQFQAAPCTCHTFSKCVRKGSGAELSGSEAYNGLVLPLAKALQHFVQAQQPPSTACYFDCHATLAVAVLDAPMISVRTARENQVLTAVPWVRVIRHEYDSEAERFDRDQLLVIDVVHRAFLDSYLDDHAVPFARRFAERVLRHPTELATGEAFAAGMGNQSGTEIESRMQPRSMKARTSRVAAVGRNVRRILSGKEP